MANGYGPILSRRLRRPGDRRRAFLHYMRQYWPFYVMILPALLDTLIFRYWPMYGVQIAFRDYRVRKGIWGSEWVGMEHMMRFLNSSNFWPLMRNTFLLAFYSLLWGFPIPIILALMMNELTGKGFKRTVQMLTYAPYFLSSVAIVGLINLFFQRETGLVNVLAMKLGFPDHNYLSDPSWFRTLYIGSGVWQGAGWGTIIYMAALSGVESEVLEAAVIDGANRMQKILYINLPTILPTIVILLIMNTGSLLSVGFEKVFLMQNKLNMDVSDVISTYTYRLGILDGQFSYTTAIGLANSVVNAVILVAVNFIAGRVGETSLW